MNKLKIVLLSPLAIGRLLVAVLFTFVLYLIVAGIDIFYKKKPQELLRAYMSYWCRNMLSIMGVKVHVEYEEKPDKPALILSNHRSYIDIFINLAINPGRIIAKKEVASWPMLGRGIRIYDVLQIDRSSMNSRIENIRKMENVLLNNQSLIIYPEGTTHRGPGLGPIRESTYRIASNNNFPVYPVAIEYKNPDDAWVGKDLFVPHFIRRAGVPKRYVGVKVGKSIQTTDNKELKAYVEGFMQRETMRMREEFDSNIR
ncbi:1-acyl-sn-glycerol-3-phosphate acyltransferase [Salinivirga cyanobacteriivorans]|uniref:1-acyl-sn-glycerol-3-phosphate acyltransferase n=1 Tax=Salinivirga cyanobacteriivorans TaxID=1307839 RepID=A0A0S2HYZ5_9BACT|nr:lysophospholipid acyltransferase family protein [Salinivirga cyanobacteriivorans]ALO15315.1 1-acyl-sn-glycerol-3-phosphate acyltransferase [Salinivirga cyanobacteriivorans]